MNLNDYYDEIHFAHSEGYAAGEDETLGSLAYALVKAEELHPYKQSGNAESYSDYNQGWVSALEYVADKLDIDF